MSRKLRADYDAVWKEALEKFFPDFMQFFLPQAYVDIDKSQETRPDSRTRLVERLHLERKLRSIGLKQEDASNLMTLVDGLMKLDSALESELYAIVAAEEAEEGMALTNYIERRGHQRGFEEGLLQGEIEGKVEGKAEGLLTAIKLSLQLMRGDPGVVLYAEVAKIKDPVHLEEFYARLIGGATREQLQEFCQSVR
jgi:hypothetical protein